LNLIKNKKKRKRKKTNEEKEEKVVLGSVYELIPFFIVFLRRDRLRVLKMRFL